MKIKLLFLTAIFCTSLLNYGMGSNVQAKGCFDHISDLDKMKAFGVSPFNFQSAQNFKNCWEGIKKELPTKQLASNFFLADHIYRTKSDMQKLRPELAFSDAEILKKSKFNYFSSCIVGLLLCAGLKAYTNIWLNRPWCSVDNKSDLAMAIYAPIALWTCHILSRKSAQEQIEAHKIANEVLQEMQAQANKYVHEE